MMICFALGSVAWAEMGSEGKSTSTYLRSRRIYILNAELVTQLRLSYLRADYYSSQALVIRSDCVTTRNVNQTPTAAGWSAAFKPASKDSGCLRTGRDSKLQPGLRRESRPTGLSQECLRLCKLLRQRLWFGHGKKPFQQSRKILSSEKPRRLERNDIVTLRQSYRALQLKCHEQHSNNATLVQFTLLQILIDRTWIMTLCFIHNCSYTRP